MVGLMMTMPMGGTEYPDHFTEFLAFLCEKYRVGQKRLFVEYSPRLLPLKGTRAGYYEGTTLFPRKEWSNRISDHGFKLSREPLLTLHTSSPPSQESESGNFAKHLRPPDDETEKNA